MKIRTYQKEDYPSLKSIYEKSGWYDAETDDEERIKDQIEKNPNSILVAEEDGKIVGTVTLLFTGRLGLFFRLISDSAEKNSELLKAGEKIFKDEGYNEVHILAPADDTNKQNEYENYGFNSGKNYKWFWKKIIS
ncbi:MAG TPA: GNAT family N-acetyltransferase [Patescibacteria group bacterium]|nr:GNAT family N-acetyltransferase [Patescibacteria group bacterium]